MAKTRTGKKVLSLLLTLCMVVSLFAGLTVTASAVVGDSWVGDEDFNYADNHTGTGFRWVASTQTLTLSGVDASKSGDDAICIAGDATIVLEGTNRVTAVAENCGLCCTGELIIIGSGTLEVTGEGENSTGVYSFGDMTINSGYITVNDLDLGVKSNKRITVSGGYVSATVSGTNGIAVDSSNYHQYGGYVRASGSEAGVNSGVTLYGGYLEANGKYGISGAAHNLSGVLKATGQTNAISGAFASSGGVTIAQSTGASHAVAENSIGLIESDVYLYDNSTGSPIYIEDYRDTTLFLNSIVIAKAVSYTGGALDGHYLYSQDADGLNMSTNLKVTSGSYVESTFSTALSSTASLTVENEGAGLYPTLVCVASGTGGSGIDCHALTIAETGTLVGISKKSVGVSAGAVIVNGTSLSSGDLIGITKEGTSGVTATPSLKVNEGYVCGINTAGTASGVSVTFGEATLSVTDGYVTALGSLIGLAVGTSTQVTGTGAITAMGFKAYSGAESTGQVTGADSTYGELEAVTYDDAIETYNVHENIAKVVCIKATPPIFNDSFGGTIEPSAAQEYEVNITTHDPKGYTFAGWFDSEGTALEDVADAVRGTTYYARWKNGGKRVVTSPLDFTNDITLPAGSGITWNSDTYTLNLYGATIDCSGVTDCFYAIQLPEDATVNLEGNSTVNAGTGDYAGSNGSIGIMCANAVSFLGDGKLDVATSAANSYSFAIFGNPTIGEGSDNPTVTATGNTAATLSYGINGNLTVNSGTVTVEAGNPTANAVSGVLITTGTVKAGASATETTTYTTGYASPGAEINAKYVNVSFAPCITVGAQDEKPVRGTAQTVIFSLTAANFSSFDPEVIWSCDDDSHGTVSFNDEKTQLTIETTEATAAGVHTFKIISGTVESDPATLLVREKLTEVDYSIKDGKLTNTTENMEYTLDGGGSWKECEAGNTTGIEFSAGITLHVRDKNDREWSRAIIDTPLTEPDVPAAPTIGTGENKPTASSISLTDVSGCEYRLGSDGTWQDSNVFTDLEAATSYTFYQRVKATADALASNTSDGAAFYTAYTTPDSTAYTIDADSLVIEFDDSIYEVSTDPEDYTSVDKVIASGDSLNAASSYYIRHKAGTGEGGLIIPASAAWALRFTVAEISDFGEINGVKGTAITPVTGVMLTLTGDTFKDSVAANTTFPTNVAGLTATVREINADKTVATVSISGTPTETKNAGLIITIPGDKLQSGEMDITSAVNSDATVKIATDKPFKREDPLDFLNSGVNYKDVYGTEIPEVPVSADITDSGEGWAWYATQAGAGTGVTAADHPAKTLILSGVDFEVSSDTVLKIPADTTVVVNGTNTVKYTGDISANGIFAEASATFTGTGTLNVDGKIHGIGSSNSLTFNGSGTIIANGNTGGGICAAVNVTISGGTVTATGTGEASHGIDAIFGGITISDGTVTAAGESRAFKKAPTIAASFRHSVIAGESADGEGATDVTNTPDLDLGSADYKYVKIAPYDAPSRPPVNPKVPVIVDGVEYRIGTAKTVGGVTTVTIDQTALQKQLDAASEAVVVPVTPGRNADTVVVRLVVANFDAMAEKEMTLSVQVDNVSYVIPAVAIDTEALMKELGATNSSITPVNVTIKQLTEDDVKLEEGEPILSPVEFEVSASYGGEAVDVEEFEQYVQRVIEVPEDVDAGQITTAVVVENGKQRHVPTEVFQKDGKWYARINSLTNSVYTLINNEKSFTDAEGKWFEDVVTEMASRGIIDGRAEGIFDGDAEITRAEFAAILVRALGLPENGDASVFTDVASTAWYYGAVGSAYEHGLVGGRGDGIFDPTAKITREEAMQMLYNASEIAPIQLLSGINPGLYTDFDTVSDWAKDAAGFNLLNGIFKGSDGLIRPLDNITRGETATIILRLLQKAGLVDGRSEA